MTARGPTALALAALVALAAAGFAGRSGSPESGWGIDACLAGHVAPAEVPGYLRLLERTSAVRWLRERAPQTTPKVGADSGPGAPRIWALERRAGFRVVAFAAPAWDVPVADPRNQLPEDLLAVYRAHRETARRTAGLVDAWEMVGEPDAFYCRDLPDRVAAHQKAVYLALKAGGNKSAFPVVLMGALAYPPGPWLELAARNGLYDYTDGNNIHHYGFASEMAALIDAHREFSRRWVAGPPPPVWVTEAGLNNIPRDDWRDPVARAAQAEYVVECARQAILARAAVFMPFILVHRGDPFAITETARDRHPAWDRYAAFTRENPLVPLGGVFSLPPPAPCPVVLQWLPAPDRALPSKVTRSYWFTRDAAGQLQSMRGELRVYNLSAEPLDVNLDALRAETPTVRVEGGEAAPLRVPAFGRITRPLTIQPPAAGYARVAVRASAGVGTGRTSRLEFVVETPAGELPPAQVLPLALAEPGPAWARIGGDAPVVETSRRAPWIGINGVDVRGGDLASGLEVFVRDRNRDAVTPPMAIAATSAGLPAVAPGFLRLRVTDPAGNEPPHVRVDLIDRDGQRWSVVENFGRNYFRDEGDTVLLAYADFHPWVFGRVKPYRAPLDPAAVREVQLRFAGPGSPRGYRVQLEVVAFAPVPKNQTPGNALR